MTAAEVAGYDHPGPGSGHGGGQPARPGAVLARAAADRGGSTKTQRVSGSGERQDAGRGPGRGDQDGRLLRLLRLLRPSAMGRTARRRPARHATRVRVEPVGVVLAICPWNDPLITPARKLGPALIAGNAVVLKAASQTPLIAPWVAGLLAESGLPDGVVQVITGRKQISDALLASPNAVTFTGSNEVGGTCPGPRRQERTATGRARRQERLRRTRRRRPRHGRRHRRQRRLRPGRPALHRHKPTDRRILGGGRAHRAAGEPGGRDRGRPRA